MSPVTVGAMRDVGENGWTLAPFSSRGPTLDGRIKPEIVAPGIRITAARAGSANRFDTYSGTSMAAPFVAGAAALLLSANPGLTVEDVKDALLETAQDWGVTGPDVDYGHGRLSVYRAVQRVSGLWGRAPDNPTHAVTGGELEEEEETWFRFRVADPSKPIGLTLILTDYTEDYYDLDLYLFDEKGNQLAASYNISRQETVNYRPRRAGIYYIQVVSVEGSGSFILDASWW
jgi:serine protease AprX